MIPMVGYDVSYRRNAFTTKIDPHGVPSGPLESLFERAAKAVQEKSDGRWMIVNKDAFISCNSDSTIELMVLVPVGLGQRDHAVAAVVQFEEVITSNTGVILNTALRIVEKDDPECQTCGKHPDWVRRTAFSGDHFFCIQHAQAEEDFGETRLDYVFWKQLNPITT